jgi:prophage regulatory protein
MSESKRLLRLPEVMSITGYGRSSIYAMLDEKNPRHCGDFPKPVRLSPTGKGAVAWPSNEIEAWIERRISSRDNS